MAPPPIASQAPTYTTPQYPPPPTAYVEAIVVPSSQWTTGLCGCFEDLESCCLTYWFPCLPFGQIAHILDEGNTSCPMAGCLLCLFFSIGVPCVYTCGYRAKLRRKYGLPEDPCVDCCVDYCCLCCSIAQQFRELKNRGIEPSLGLQQKVPIIVQQMPPPVQQMQY